MLGVHCPVAHVPEGLQGSPPPMYVHVLPAEGSKGTGAQAVMFCIMTLEVHASILVCIPGTEDCTLDRAV